MQSLLVFVMLIIFTSWSGLFAAESELQSPRNKKSTEKLSKEGAEKLISEHTNERLKNAGRQDWEDIFELFDSNMAKTNFKNQLLKSLPSKPLNDQYICIDMYVEKYDNEEQKNRKALNGANKTEEEKEAIIIEQMAKYASEKLNEWNNLWQKDLKQSTNKPKKSIFGCIVTPDGE